MREPVIITGTPRSGIWLVAGAFAAAGGFGGSVDVQESNGAGSMENLSIRDRIERPLLEGLGYDPRGLGALPPVGQISELAQTLAPQWRSLVNDSFARQHCPEDAVRFVTSQVACLLWPIWHLAFPEALWVIVRRDTGDIANSCRATGWTGFYQYPKSDVRLGRREQELDMLIDAYRVRFADMRSVGIAPYLYWPQLIYDGNLASLRTLLEIHGLTWRPDVAEYCRPYQWKHGTLEMQE